MKPVSKTLRGRDQYMQVMMCDMMRSRTSEKEKGCRLDFERFILVGKDHRCHPGEQMGLGVQDG